MNWTAVVPLRQGAEPKSRLSVRLSREQRIALSIDLVRIVTGALHRCDAIARILLLSPERPPPEVPGEWVSDRGRGLNAELNMLRHDLGDPAMLVIHGDLPLVSGEDIAALLAGAEAQGHAFAPDRHGAGTNAAAIVSGRRFTFAFGDGSLARHLEQAPDAQLVRRPGLGLDIDTPDDLKAAIAAGYAAPAKGNPG